MIANKDSTALTIVEKKNTFPQKRNMSFENLCSKTQPQLKKLLKKRFAGVEGLESGDGYLYVPGSLPILLVAHMDTVHETKPTEFIYGGINQDEITSPTGIGGDDRCGVYMILEILKKHKCHVLFTEDEEIGCAGTGKFLKTDLAKNLVDKFQYVIQLDRKGKNDAVFYSCDNPKFTDFITKEYWKEQYGSFTDISELCPFLKAAGVNFSCGYYFPHTKKEYVNLTEMDNNINEVCKLIERTTEADTYEYIRSTYSWGGYGNYRGYYGGWYDDYDPYDDYGYGSYYTGQGKLRSKYQGITGRGYGYEVAYFSPVLNTVLSRTIYAWSEEEAVGKFLISRPELSYNDIMSITDAEEEIIDNTPQKNGKEPSDEEIVMEFCNSSYY